jgi:hypothetical protein
MTDIDSKSSVFMTKKILFPRLNYSSLLTNSENQSKFKSSPSVISFVAIEQQRLKNRLNEKQELLNIEEKITKTSITPAATKSQLGNYEQIKKILLTLSAETKVIGANPNHPNRSDSIDSWSVLSNLEKRKPNYQKYFTNSYRIPSQKSSTSIASVTPLEQVSSKTRLNEIKLKPPMEIIGKSNLATDAKSTKLEAEAITNSHHFPDWQLHLLNYKLKKGHYLKPADSSIIPKLGNIFYI